MPRNIKHVVPKSRGGSNDIDNLQWTTLQANTAKQDMTHDEFVAFIRLLHSQLKG